MYLGIGPPTEGVRPTLPVQTAETWLVPRKRADLAKARGSIPGEFVTCPGIGLKRRAGSVRDRTKRTSSGPPVGDKGPGEPVRKPLLHRLLEEALIPARMADQA